jgi:AcrR family transcriptional regulator
VLRDGDSRDLREYLIATAARMIGERGSAGLAVRDIAREAKVADGVLYDYFEDKEDLLVHALLAYVGAVMASVPQMPPAGTATVAENLGLFIDRGLGTLTQVMPAFAGLLSQPKVLRRFHAIVGGDAAFGVATAEDASPGPAEPADESDGEPGGEHGRGLGDMLTRYLRAEQRLGRVGAGADIDAASTLIVGAIHGQILPTVLLNPGAPVSNPPGLAARLADTVLAGIAPRSPSG